MEKKRQKLRVLLKALKSYAHIEHVPTGEALKADAKNTIADAKWSQL